MKKAMRICLTVGGFVLAAALAAVLYLALLFKDQYQALSSIRPVAPDLYEMTYRGDYGISEYIERGGVHSDEELRPFLQHFLSHGLMPVEAPEVQTRDFGCSTLCAPETGREGYIFGRNFDWAKKGKTLIIRSLPRDGYASISTSNLDFLNMSLSIDTADILARMPVLAALYVPVDGMNEKGLMVADLFAGDHETTAQERGNLAVTTTTAIRLLLDKAATTDEALEMLNSWDMHSSIDWAHHLAIADATGHAVVVEWIDNTMYVSETPAVTNHYISPLRPGVGIGPTESRRDTLCARLEMLQTMSADDMMTLLSDVSFEDYTDWSIVFRPSELSASYYYRTDYSKCYTYTIQ